jgi:hypothetical protein
MDVVMPSNVFNVLETIKKSLEMKDAKESVYKEIAAL